MLSSGAIVDSNDVFYLATIENDNWRMLAFVASTPPVSPVFDILRFTEYSHSYAVTFGST
jgi:hypothetical protein